MIKGRAGFFQDSNDIPDIFFALDLPEEKERTWGTIADGYRHAAEVLGGYILKEPRDLGRINTVGFPLMFLWRHYLELRLKSILHVYDIEYEEKHGLLRLWKQIRMTINGLMTQLLFVTKVLKGHIHHWRL